MAKIASKIVTKILDKFEITQFLQSVKEEGEKFDIPNIISSFSPYKRRTNNRLKVEVKTLRRELEGLKSHLRNIAPQKEDPFAPSEESQELFEECPWGKFWDAEVSKNFIKTTQTLMDRLDESVEIYSHNNMITFQGATISYAKANEYINASAYGLQQMGVKKGDRVAIQLPNIPQTIFAYYATLKLGAIVVFVNPLYTEEEITHQLNDSGAKFLITLDILFDKRIRGIQDQLKHLKHCLTCEIKTYLPPPLKQLYPIKAKKTGMLAKIQKDDHVQSFDKLTLESPTYFNPVKVELQDTALLQYTGGTTGKSKGAMLTHRNISTNLDQFASLLYTSEPGEETVLAVVPLFHVWGMAACMNYSISIGANIVLIPKFDIDMVVKAINRYQPTFFPGVPTMYVGFNNYPDIEKLDVSSIKSCFSGSAPLPKEVLEKFERITGAKIIEGFGLSECSPVTHANPLYGKRKEKSIGIPIPGTRAKVVNMETREECPTGEPGELLIKGPQVMAGYWKQEEKTNETLVDGWLHTGDVAYVDEDGYFFIVDRLKDMIIAGGYNIYPRDIDEVLFKHPKVADAVAVGIPDEYRGETVKAYVVVKDDEIMTEKEVIEYCKKHLAVYKVPKLVEFREELPKNMVGKILRKTLREEEEEKSKVKSIHSKKKPRKKAVNNKS
mgnify:CR=1 FL=1